MALAERELSFREDAAPDPIRWTREQYHRMGEAGILDDLRVELIEGEIILMPPIGSRHFTSVALVTQALSRAFASGFIVTSQSAVAAGPRSEPQPDVAVYAGDIRDYKDALPTTALLIVEVSDSTLTTDRTRKAALYAKIGVPDYWIVNLKSRQLEVCRVPTMTEEGGTYQERRVLPEGETIAPLAAPECTIPIQDLLP